jgi:5-methylcytosine-specific restriction enzyme A
MTRSVEEWIGANDDQSIPNRVKARIWLKYDGRCAICTRPIKGSVKPAYDHIVALCNSGQNGEANLQLLCVLCHSIKTGKDVAVKSIDARVRAKHIGLTTKRAKIQSAGFRKAAPQRTATRPLVRRISQTQQLETEVE